MSRTSKFFLAFAGISGTAGALIYTAYPQSCISRQMEKWKTDEIVATHLCATRSDQNQER